MNVGLFGRVINENYYDSVKDLIALVEKSGGEIFIYNQVETYFKDKIGVNPDFKTFRESTVSQLDVLISLGGDGTILKTMNIIRDSGVPVFGVNTGRLGFLSTIGIEDIKTAIPNVLKRNFTLDKRSLIKVSTDREIDFTFPYAMNEITVHKKDTSSMITVQAWMNDAPIASYWADGLIMSTPTGSTAYSLSCGGPIVMPNSENFVITPIAPHNLNVRPLVISNNDTKITLKSVGREKEIILTLDSNSYTIDVGTEIYLEKAEFYLNLVRLPEQDFFSTIRNKLLWGMDKRN